MQELRLDLILQTNWNEMQKHFTFVKNRKE